MATTLAPIPAGRWPHLRRVVTLYLEWKTARHARKVLRTIIGQARAEIYWLRSQVEIAHATNKRVSEINEQHSEEIEDLKHELERFRIIDPTYPCQACGNRHDNKLKSLIDPEKKRVVVQLTCGACSFQQAHDTVTADAYKVFQPTPGEEEMKFGSTLGI